MFFCMGFLFFVDEFGHKGIDFGYGSLKNA